VVLALLAFRVGGATMANDRDRNNPNIEDEEVGRSNEDMSGRGDEADEEEFDVEEFEDVDMNEDDEEDLES
jgi:hypothetical protein